MWFILCVTLKETGSRKQPHTIDRGELHIPSKFHLNRFTGLGGDPASHIKTTSEWKVIKTVRLKIDLKWVCQNWVGRYRHYNIVQSRKNLHHFLPHDVSRPYFTNSEKRKTFPVKVYMEVFGSDISCKQNGLIDKKL